VRAGKVRVNGRIVRAPETPVEAGDAIEIGGRRLELPSSFTYWVLHKPVGVVTTMRDPQRRRTVAQLVPQEPRVVPVGRLDFDSSGVLLLTNDGDLAYRLLHPRFGVEKRYRVTLGGRLSAQDVRALHAGVVFDDRPAGTARVRVVASGRNGSVVDVTIHEGRNRQLRRMFDALGQHVIALERLRFGPIALGGLAPGNVRGLTPRERSALESYRADGG
jgi:23S rRNA pseudouridine2605 synthase